MRHIIALIFMCWWVWFAPLTRSQSNSQTADVVGYIFYAAETGMILQAVDHNGNFTEEAHTLEGFDIYGEDEPEARAVYIADTTMAISPDGGQLAFSAFTVEDTGEEDSGASGFKLFLYTFDTRTLRKYDTDTDISVSPVWSPDGSAVLLDAWSEGMFVFDVQTEQITRVVDHHVTAPKWLPDSQRFLYVGPAVCEAERCNLVNDLYVGDRSGLRSRAITDTVSEAERLFADSWQNPLMFISTYVWHAEQQRVYFEFGDADQSIANYIYSTTFDGQQRMEVDLSTVAPVNRGIITSVKRFFYDPARERLHSIVERQSLGAYDYHWEILEYSDGQPNYLFNKRFANGTSKIISWISVSLSRRYIAMSGVTPVRSEGGNIIAVDLHTGATVFELDGLRPVCNVYWADESTLIYPQSDERLCRFTTGSNQPAERFIWHDIESDEARTIQIPTAPFIYFLPKDPSEL